MEAQFYVFTRIDGEYAYIKEKVTGEELFIALALLPIGADVGSLIKYENMEFSFA